MGEPLISSSCKEYKNFKISLLSHAVEPLVKPASHRGENQPQTLKISSSVVFTGDEILLN